ncbi:hypothetical protein CGK17_24010, partial [Vibrio parahaemolyticus]|uniref:hypothetical protein n=1 Tax=Vibrio parahaemolyticus TaxID=670 RepID=UPI001168C510
IISGDLALSLDDYLDKSQVNRNPLSLLLANQSNVRVLDKNIFSIEDDFIYFNEENEESIVKFFNFIAS